MSVQTQQATNARVQATVQQQLEQFSVAMRARELTFNRMMTERQEKQAGELGALIREVEGHHNRRLEQLERPWWKRMLGRHA